MHEFYERVQKVFKNAGSNRNQFCKKYGYKYQTLQAYWNTDKLPSGKVLEDLAKEYHVSIDALVFGKSTASLPEENPIISRIVGFLRQQDEQNLLRIEGALQMLEALARSRDMSRLASGKPADEVEIMPERIERAFNLLEEMAKLIRKSDMNEEKKKAVEKMMNQVVITIYEREVKDEWGELEEVE